MTSFTLDELSSARDHLEEVLTLAAPITFMGVGVNCVLVGLLREVTTELPTEVQGVPITYTVTGPLKPESSEA